MIVSRGILVVIAAWGLTAVSYATNTMTIQGLAFGPSATDTAKVNGLAMFAGPVSASINGGTAFQTFNADLSRGEILGTPLTVTFEDTANMGANYQYAARLYNAFLPTVGSNALDNAGLQVAIWKALYPTLTYTDYLEAGVASQANVYLGTNVSAYSDHAGYYSFSGHNAGQIGPVLAPEPAPIVCLAVGTVGLASRRRRSR